MPDSGSVAASHERLMDVPAPWTAVRFEGAEGGVSSANAQEHGKAITKIKDRNSARIGNSKKSSRFQFFLLFIS